VLLGVQGEEQLLDAFRRISESGIRCIPFREPDIGNQLTAIATEPIVGDSRRSFKKYRLLSLKTSWFSGLRKRLVSFLTFSLIGG
jgi:hypothetical protein